jgi:adenosylhomocysteine nucleosidase
MPHKPVAIVVAMARELAPLLRGRRQQKSGGLGFVELDTAVVAVGGIGRHPARRAAEAAVRAYRPSVLISAGIAGALTPHLTVGDVLQARGVVDAETGVRFAASGDSGTIATVSSVSGPGEKRRLAAQWRADVVDMEASAVAQVAVAGGIEFVALKAVSDQLEFVMPPVGRFVNDAGKFETLRFSAFLALHPEWWRAVRELNRNSRTAALKLSEAVQHLIDQRSQTTAESRIVEA